MSQKRSVLIINRTAPYGSSNAREALDVALTCSIFEIPVSLLFMGDAVFQLLKGQQPEQIGQKNLQSMLSALPMYDIENLYVMADAMTERGLQADDLCIVAKQLDNTALTQLINSHDTVLTF